MTNSLHNGWWRCNCQIPCGCGSRDITVRKIRQPTLDLCAECGAGRPTSLDPISELELRREKRRVERELRRLSR